MFGHSEEQDELPSKMWTLKLMISHVCVHMCAHTRTHTTRVYEKVNSLHNSTFWAEEVNSQAGMKRPERE